MLRLGLFDFSQFLPSFQIFSLFSLAGSTDLGGHPLALKCVVQHILEFFALNGVL